MAYAIPLSLHADTHDARFDPVGYFTDMLDASVVAVERRDDGVAQTLAWRELDSGAARALLLAVTSLNHPYGEAGESDPLEQMSDSGARRTLQLCQALGWTPAQVLASPAFEIERLIRLLDRTTSGNSAPGAARPPRLADHPDAVVIEFGSEPDA